jgi:hypothetical protein
VLLTGLSSKGLLARLKVNALNGALNMAAVDSEDLLIPASNELYQPLDYVQLLANSSWLTQLYSINGNNTALVNEWSR